MPPFSTIEGGSVGYSSNQGPPSSEASTPPSALGTRSGPSPRSAASASASSPVSACTRTSRLAASPWAMPDSQPAGSSKLCGNDCECGQPPASGALAHLGGHEVVAADRAAASHSSRPVSSQCSNAPRPHWAIATFSVRSSAPDVGGRPGGGLGLHAQVDVVAAHPLGVDALAQRLVERHAQVAAQPGLAESPDGAQVPATPAVDSRVPPASSSAYDDGTPRPCVSRS